jgi:hypothetical protein
MLSGKFLFTLIGLMMAVLAICNLNLQQNTVENFWGIQRKWKVLNSTKGPRGASALGGQFLGGMGEDAFVKTPAFQSLMSPRFNATGMTPNIRYNPPPVSMQASVPCDPLMTGGMATENYTPNVQENYPTSCGSGCGTGGCAAGCGKGGMSVPYKGAPATKPGFAAGDYDKVLNKAIASSDQPEIVDSLPMGTMTNILADGTQVNPVVYQNFIFANNQSRLRQYGDPIRGDLPIVPCEGNWFSVHPNVNLDLQQGAMNVLAGNMNQTARATQQLVLAASGVVTPMAGQLNPFEDIAMTPSYAGGLGAAGSDIQIRGMP